MAGSKKSTEAGLRWLWPTPIMVKTHPEHAKLKPQLLDLFADYRRRHEKTTARVFASRDNLLDEFKDPAFGKLVRFISDSVFELASKVNREVWPRGCQLEVRLTGIWFQVTNGYGFHETHVHGNASWSGVYYVQAGDMSTDAVENTNGITRFYGPHLDAQAGGYMDFGNFYLQQASFDSCPADGKLCLFPTHIKHMAMPYNGEQDRIIVSFHAQVVGDLSKLVNYSFS